MRFLRPGKLRHGWGCCPVRSCGSGCRIWISAGRVGATLSATYWRGLNNNADLANCSKPPNLADDWSLSQIVTTTTKVRQVVRDALQALAPSLKTVAERLGLSHDMLRRYRVGDRRVPTAVLRRLAKALRLQAASLLRHAKGIEREADRDP